MAKRVVTEKQRACYELRAAGRTWDEIGLSVGLSPQTCRTHVRSAEKNGMPALKHGPGPGKPAKSSPEARRDLVESLGLEPGKLGEFDLKKFAEFAGQAGITPRLALALGRRIQLNFGGVKEQLKRLTLAEQVAATQDKAQMVLSYIDELSIAGMNAKDLALAYGILVDKAQLLGGKPTQVFDFNLRAKLEVLMPQFLAEARRRNITVDGTATVVPDQS